MKKVHATLGASSAHRWIACPGSIRLSEGQPRYETDAARAGTAAHEVAELCLKHDNDAVHYVGEIIGEVEITEEMAENVQQFVDLCREVKVNSTVSWVEQSFSLEALSPPDDMFGTADFVAYSEPEKTLHVLDYKNGVGLVEAEGNPQLLYYALGAVLELGEGLNIETIKVTIVQPNASHPKGIARTWTISYVDLLDFAGELMAAARATQDPAAPLKTGSHCKFCPASAVCPARKAEAESVALVEFEALPVDAPPPPETLPVEVLADILEQLPRLKDWIKDVEAHGTALLISGTPIRGQKMVARRAKRVWKNETDVVYYLRNRAYGDEEIYEEPKLKSPAKIEKMIGKKNLDDDLWEKKSSGYTMVHESDRREAVALSAVDEFDALPSGDEE